MKQTKPYLLVLVSIFLIVSIGLLGATAYLYFNSNANFAGIVSEPDNKLAANKDGVEITKDSLDKLFNSAITNADSTAFSVVPANYIDSASLSGRDAYLDSLNNPNLQAKSFNSLGADLNKIILDKNSTVSIDEAKTKISELKALNEGLKNKNNTIIKENDRLFNMVTQLSTKTNAAPQNTIANTQPLTTQFSNKTSALLVNDIQLNAFTSTNFTDKETQKASEADKMVGTVVLKNNGIKAPVAEVMVVVTQPNGKVIQNSNWESGVFNTPKGKKIYSNKLRFDNDFTNKSKKVQFALQADQYMPGNYTVELYQEGVLIAKTTKSFN
jgi:hypothetical protein